MPSSFSQSLLLMIDSPIWISEYLSLVMRLICASFLLIFRNHWKCLAAPSSSIISQNSQTHSNNSSANCRRIVWVCLTILWHWHLRVKMHETRFSNIYILFLIITIIIVLYTFLLYYINCNYCFGVN